jgi:hypothetical protein
MDIEAATLATARVQVVLAKPTAAEKSDLLL